jgi:hypothetical protein
MDQDPDPGGPKTCGSGGSGFGSGSATLLLRAVQLAYNCTEVVSLDGLFLSIVDLEGFILDLDPTFQNSRSFRIRLWIQVLPIN